MRVKLLNLPKAVLVFLAVLMVAGFLLIMNLSGLAVSMFLPNEGYLIQGVAELVAAVYTLGMLFLCGYGRALREKGEGFVKGFYIGGFMTVYCFLMVFAMLYMQLMIQSGVRSFGMIIIYVLTMFLVGFNEEIIVRGLVLNLLLDRFENTRKGVLGAVILSSIIFGCAHLPNVLSGVDFTSVAIQSVQATLLGILFAAVYIRSGNLWVCIIIHAVVDFAGLMGTGVFDNGEMTDMIGSLSWINLAVTVPLFLIPLIVLLRKRKLDEVVKMRSGEMVVPTMREAENVAGISLAMGIFGIVVGCAGYTMGFSVVGLLGSLISRRIKPERNGMAMAAMITSIVGIVISCIGVIYMSLMMPMMSDMDYMNILYNF